jgi:hypothetical protein
VVSGERDEQPPQTAPVPKHAGRQEVWPTLWHKDQIPFPWGGAKRLRKRPAPRLDATAIEGLRDELRAELNRERPDDPGGVP